MMLLLPEPLPTLEPVRSEDNRPHTHCPPGECRCNRDSGIAAESPQRLMTGWLTSQDHQELGPQRGQEAVSEAGEVLGEADEKHPQVHCLLDRKELLLPQNGQTMPETSQLLSERTTPPRPRAVPSSSPTVAELGAIAGLVAVDLPAQTSNLCRLPKQMPRCPPTLRLRFA